MAKATMARTMPSEPATKDPTRSFFSRGIFPRPIPEGVTGLKERNVIGSHGCILLFAFKGGTAPGSTEEAIFDFGWARRAFLQGYPSPANRTHYAREKKKGAVSKPLVWNGPFFVPDWLGFETYLVCFISQNHKPSPTCQIGLFSSLIQLPAQSGPQCPKPRMLPGRFAPWAQALQRRALQASGGMGRPDVPKSSVPEVLKHT